MARLEFITFDRSEPIIEGDNVQWEPRLGKPISKMPLIVWSTNLPWREANVWSLENASNSKRSQKTILSAMNHICAYAKWLEQENIDWWHFPLKESERCLFLFRGAVMEMRDQGIIAPSTASQRMSAVIRFYRWLVKNSLISTDQELWNETSVGIRVSDNYGFQRTMNVKTTNLAIPNRRRPGDLLEGGLLPVPTAAVENLLAFAATHASLELYLMLRLGFGTGMRFGSIAGLKTQTIERAVEDPNLKGFYRLSLGPGASPPVHTKFGVTGEVWIHKSDLDDLKAYSYSSRRLLRKAKADSNSSDFIFLNRFGRTYANDGFEVSRGISVEIGRLRRKGFAAGIPAYRNFKFHQTRCTFATELARAALKHGGTAIAVNLVKQALLHKNESTTIGYIRFIEKTAVMAQAADEFFYSFLGLAAAKLETD